MSKTTLDLSTLSDITDGTHTVKVKAKANGYRDSEFSNEVSYTKAPSVYNGYVQCAMASDYGITVWHMGESVTISRGKSKDFAVPVGDTLLVEANATPSRGFTIDKKNATSVKLSADSYRVTPTDNDWYASFVTHA